LKKVFISTTSFAQFSKEPMDLLKSNGFEVTMNDLERKLGKSDCLKIFSKYEGIIAGTEIFDKSVIDFAKNLKVISRVGVGLDNIDREYTAQKGIKVYKSKTEPSLAVAELVLGLILDLVRKISLHNDEMKRGKWNKKMGMLFSGKTLGIIGLGNIGKTLVKITQGLSLKYLAYDKLHDNKFAKNNLVEYCELEHLLQSSDIISIHLSLTEGSFGLLSKKEFNLMKKSAILLNASRGEIIDEKALINAISNNIIGGAGLDVYQSEPYNGSLVNYDNVVLTPHIGSYAKEIRMAMELEAVQNLIKGFQL